MGFNTFPCNPYPISTEELNKGNNDDLNTRVTALEGDISDLESQKANQITIALSFNPETTYNPGDLVYYNGLTYRCTNEHTGEWDADDFAGTTIANELSELKSGLTNVTNFELINSTFYSDVGTGVSVNNTSCVTKCGKHIVGDAVLVLDNNLSGQQTNLLTLAYRPKNSLNTFCAAGTTAYNVTGLLYMWVSFDSGVVTVENTTSLENIRAVKIHLDYYTDD